MIKQNLLANTKSPYLLQHANNPVDWFPWCEEAFKKAAKKDKPIFLSIGYSTCHWCHVMAHESFEDEQVAELMNEAFVSIKVDREERPDIDGIYMNVCQMLTGSGGWPLTIILTPDKKPFFAGTYFPKEGKFGRIGMLELVPRIKDIWENKRDDISNSIDQILIALDSQNLKSKSVKITENILDTAYNQFNRRFDSTYGGFGNSPKFPSPHNLIFLLRYWKRTGEIKALEMAEKTLTEMRKGGIYDHIGFGFHRYSTDKNWLVPHFEKMLYDQALLAMAYTEAYSATRNKLYKKTALEIFEYISRDMTSPNGGFYSAEDADSESEEGKFYLWNVEELKAILGEKEFKTFSIIYNISETGNWVDPMIGGSNGTNIIHTTKSLQDLCRKFSLNQEELEILISKMRLKLFEVRKNRVHPYKDDKILTDWNGLMISAFAIAAQIFGDDKLLLNAQKAINFILDKMKTSDRKLLHRFREGDAGINANLDDYAFIINALIDLYEADFNSEHLTNALEFNQILLKHFWDNVNGGFYFTPDDGEELITRQKEIYDGAIPSGNSMMFYNLLRLSKITGNIDFENKASQIGQAFSDSFTSTPSAFTQTLIAFDFAFGPTYEIVISEGSDNMNPNEILNLIRQKYLSNKVIILRKSDKDKINKISSFVTDQRPIDGKTTVYICQNFRCKMPVTDFEKIEELIS